MFKCTKSRPALAGMLVLGAGLTVLHGATAHAQNIDPATAEKVIAAAQKVIGFLAGDQEGPDIPLLIQQSTTQIINEIRSVRNEGLDARIESILWDHREWLGNPDRPEMDDHMQRFFSASLEVIAHMKRIIDGGDYQSAHHFAPAFNVMLTARASAMKMRATWFMQADFDVLFDYWVQGNYRLVGAREVSFPCRRLWWFGTFCPKLNTVRQSQAAKSISDYWFTSIRNGEALNGCKCNVTANKCVHPWNETEVAGECGLWVPGEGTHWESPSHFLDGEWNRIWFNKFLPDPSVRVARGALQALMEYGHNEVANNWTITVL